MAGEPDRSDREDLARTPLATGKAQTRGWTTANDNELKDHNDENTLVWWRRYLSSIPEDAQAVIEPDPLSTSHGGRARRDRWRLRFPMREKPAVDWLMGWTGGADPLANVILNFPNRASAESFCTLQGIRFEVVDGPTSHSVPVNRRSFELEDDEPIIFD